MERKDFCILLGGGAETFVPELSAYSSAVIAAHTLPDLHPAQVALQLLQLSQLPRTRALQGNKYPCRLLQPFSTHLNYLLELELCQ